MRSSINNYRDNIKQFVASSDVLMSSWTDNVGDAFYREIINQLKEESARMETAMQTLITELEQLKIQIDEI